MPREKLDLHIWLPRDLVEELKLRAKAQDRPLNEIAARLMKQGLADESAKQIERKSLPLLREVLGEDQAAALEELRKMIRADVRADIVEITSKQTDRLAALQVRVGRSAALTWRLIYRMVQKQFGAPTAEAWYTESRDLAGKAMATKVDSGKEIDQ